LSGPATTFMTQLRNTFRRSDCRSAAIASSRPAFRPSTPAPRHPTRPSPVTSASPRRRASLPSRGGCSRSRPYRDSRRTG
jgi:hypothetical protein